jgi:uncharacterized membrane protein YhaH (DUF805 family)
MDFLTKDFFARGLTAEGRSTRKSYWMNFLVTQIIIAMVLALIAPIASSIYTLIILIPSVMITIRRFHDTGRSGWNYLWIFTIIGVIWVIFLLIIKGDEGENSHGSPSNIS